MQTLIEKYNTAAPRYTSYPTVPYWDNAVPAQQTWAQLVKNTWAQEKNKGLSLYIHLPFCESLCTYCGCNTRITVNHGVEKPYMEALIKEWRMYLALLGGRPCISEVHLGGGTPTFFSAQNLGTLMREILSQAVLMPDAALSFEAHPNNTTAEHLQVLYNAGFRRLSLGIQDFDPKVQFIINRIQPYGKVEEVTRLARETGYTSINFDLVYGLPLQQMQGMQQTIAQVLQLKPDRIAFYSYAHVPWIKPGQRKFTEKDLPAGEVKRALYEAGRTAFAAAGYTEIGFDHFALPHDALCTAAQQGSLNRNFMGYTTAGNRLLIGLGASSISDAWGAFIQNEKKVEDYYTRIGAGMFPFFRGHVLTHEDLVLRQHILQLMCRQETSWADPALQCQFLESIGERLAEPLRDGLAEMRPNGVVITEKGRAFMRNICMAFDARLYRQQPTAQVFSAAV